MKRVERSAHVVLCLLLIAAGQHSEIARADISGLGNDGWHTWQVEAVDDAPEMCCFSWRSGAASRKQCDLDGRNGVFGSGDDPSTSDSAVQIYALMKGGGVTKIRALSSSCPVVSDSQITDLGLIDPDDSVDWLEQFIGGKEFGSDALAAVAVHDGAMARTMLTDAAKPDNKSELREEAIFWMAQVRVAETADDIKRYIFADESADIREHAAFAYSQSKASDVAATLIQQGQTDDNADVRSQAWFWLAQTEAAESEAAIHDALLNDVDEDVREEAVFALSQLPEGRAVNALAAILEDKSLDMDLREQALFWLAQTESDEAFEYIDRLLSDS
jgi:HEAT repeat protein